MLFQWIVTGTMVMVCFFFAFRALMPKAPRSAGACNCSGCDQVGALGKHKVDGNVLCRVQLAEPKPLVFHPQQNINLSVEN